MNLNAPIQKFLDKHSSSADVQSILDGIARKVPFINLPCSTGMLILLQLSHPVAQRQEIFLGNVLFNAFLGLTMQRALQTDTETDTLSVVHDLESYYLLVHTTKTLDALHEKIRQAWIDGLEELYFSEPTEDEAEDAAHSGFFGKFSNMLANYYKSNIQPFPLMIVPLVYAEKLEKRIRAYLLDKLDSGVWTKEVANFTANFSYFYGQTSGGSGDVQSSPNFLRRLVAEYQVISREEMIAAFQLPSNANFDDAGTKTQIQEKLFKKGDSPAFYTEQLKQVFEQALQHFGDSIEKQALEEGEPSEWLFRYHREKGVFLDLSPEELIDELTIGAAVGGRTISKLGAVCSNESCIMCGLRQAKLTGATIISTDSFSKFHNHTINRGTNEKRICYNCALYAYLTIKLSGSKSGGMGQIPRIGNVVFHYGDYTNSEIRELADRFEDSIRYLTKSAETDEDQSAYLENFESIFGPDEQTAQETAKVLRSLLIRNDSGEIRLFPVGFGERKLVLFLLPGLNDNIQKRVSFSRYTTMNLLSWLYRVGNSKGSFYYLSLPRSEQALQDESRLYIQGRAYDADSQIQLNDYYKKVVPSLAGSRLKGGYEHQIIVAERVQNDPLGVFSHELRGWLQDGRVSVERQAHFYNLFTVLRKIEREDKEDQVMVTEVLGEKLTREEVRGILEEFTDRMFHTFDMLDLLPKSLSERPHAFEKWARDLIAPLKRNDLDFDEVFEKWQGRVLRQNSFYPNGEKSKFPLSDEVRHRRIDILQDFKVWCFDPEHPQRKELIKKNVSHLLVILMARAYSYLYPVLELCRQYTWSHVGEKEFFTKEVIEEKFESEVTNSSKRHELADKGHLTEKHVSWAKAHMWMFSWYYEKFKQKEQMTGGIMQ